MAIITFTLRIILTEGESDMKITFLKTRYYLTKKFVKT